MTNLVDSEEWSFDVVRMAWGQWRASAIKRGSLDRAIDGPYRDTADEALRALRGLLGDAEVFGYAAAGSIRPTPGLLGYGHDLSPEARRDIEEIRKARLV